MDGLFRRGGVWYARLVIPSRLRSVLGRTEFIASTSVRDPVLARVVAAQLLAGWRRTLLDLTRIVGDPIDVERAYTGHPELLGGGYLTLALAASASGISDGTLLRAASEGGIKLYYRCSGLSGHLCSDDEFENEIGPDGITLLVPTPEQMSEYAIPTNHNGIVRLRDLRASAMTLIAGRSANAVLFDLPESPGQYFAPARPIDLNTSDIEVSAVEVECLRKAFASTITPEQIELAQAERIASAPTINPKSRRKLSEAVDAYMTVRARACNAEQARRVRSALDLLIELESDPCLSEISSDMLEAFRDNKLVTVPAKENKVRQVHGTRTISESIRAVEGTDWPRLSPAEQVKRLHWISGLFAWLKMKEWIDRDPSLALVKESSAGEAARKTKERSQDARDPFMGVALVHVRTSLDSPCVSHAYQNVRQTQNRLSKAGRRCPRRCNGNRWYSVSLFNDHMKVGVPIRQLSQPADPQVFAREGPWTAAGDARCRKQPHCPRRPVARVQGGDPT